MFNKIASILFSMAALAALAAHAQTTTVTGISRRAPQTLHTTYSVLRMHEPKIAVYNLDLTVFLTKEGQASILDIRSRYAPRVVELSELRNAVTSAQKHMAEELQQPGADRLKLLNEVTDAENQAAEFQSQLEADEREATKQATQAIASKLASIAQEYARKNGYDLLVDLGGPSNPIAWVRDADDIKFQVAAAYDAASAADSTALGKPSK